MLFCWVLMMNSGWAATYYADASRPDDSGDGTSWATAKQTIQAAVELALAGDTVLVTNGVYDVGSMVTPGFSSMNRVCVTNVITVQSVNGAEVTTIDGGDAMRCVYMSAGTMSGFTLTNGLVTGGAGAWQDTSGGGAFVEDVAVMNRCVLSGNSAELFGGGALVYGSLNQCILSGNSADYNDGGGAYVFGTLNNCLCVGNSAGHNGGGAGLAVWGKLINCTLSRNLAAHDGGGVWGLDNCSINNCIAWGNTSIAENNDVYAVHLFDIHNTCASDGIAAGQNGCITNNPLLVSTNDFRLQAGSPCINAGNNGYAPAGTDLARNTRIIFGTVDMGAYEVQVLLSTNRGPAVGGGSLVVTNGHLGDGADITNVTVCGSVASVIDQGSNWVQVTLGASTNFALDLTGDVVIRSTLVGETTFADRYTYERGANLSFYVDASRPDDSGDGSSWGTAKRTIQAAVDLTYDGDSVWVTNGVYDVGEMVTPGFSSTNRVCVTKAITVQSVNGAEVTVLDGGGSIRCVYLGAGTMSGFTLTNGDVSITNGNFENTSGGGAFLLNGAVMHSCTLSGSSAMHGGGAYVIGSTLSNCVLSSNSATYDGGGVDGFATLDNCLFVGNSAGGEGGGAYGINKLNNCTLVGNSAVQGCGGAYLDMSARICNSVAWGNTSSIGNHDIGGVLYDCYNTCASDGVTAGQNGCITNNPLFVSTNDFRLQAGSPCINAGNNAYAQAGTDLAGNTRIIFGTVDMGAYEVQVLLSTNRGPAVGGGSLVVTNGHLGDGADITNVMVCGSVASVIDQGSNWVQVMLGASTNFALDLTGDVVIQSTSVGETTFADAYTYELRSNMVFYADASRADDSGDGTSWTTAKRTIQAAVDLTYAGDSVWVTNGVYDEGGSVSTGYTLTNRVYITKAITVRSVNGPDVTCIEGNKDLSGGDGNGPAAIRAAYVGYGGTLSGFTLQGGATLATGSSSHVTSGGGAYVDNGMVTNCIIRQNTGGTVGGLAAISAVIASCRIVDNVVTSDYTAIGGMCGMNCTLTDCHIRGNAATGLVQAAGGIVLTASRNVLRRCRIDHNRAVADLGLAWGAGAFRECTIENCAVHNNLAAGLGVTVGGLQMIESQMQNCTVAMNTSSSMAGSVVGGVWGEDGSISSCVIADNVITVTTNNPYSVQDLICLDTDVAYSCSPDITNGVGNLTADPQFVDSSNEVFRLQWASPCIEAGANGAWTAADCDLDGCPRLAGARVDMGCYEVPQGPERMLVFTNDRWGASYTSVVQVADSDSLDLTNGFTCELWFMPAAGWDTNLLFSKLPEPADTGFGLHYVPGVGDSFVFNAWGRQEYVFSSANIDFVWHHIAVVFDADNNVTFYVNGVSNVTIAGAAPAGVGTGALQLGFMEGMGTGYNGAMDEIRFWGVERTPEEIRDNMHRHLTGVEPGLAAYYRCNQVDGDGVPDWSTNGNDGTLSSCAWEDSSAILGNDQVAQLDNARAVWTAYEAVTPFAPGGLQLSRSGVMGLGRSVFAHNGQSGVVYSNLAEGLMRSSRIWYNETAPSNSYALDVSCVFEQCGAEALRGCSATNYQLLYRAGENGDFAVVGSGASVSTGKVDFTNVAMTTGWYALGVAQSISVIPDNGPLAGGNTVCFSNGLFGVVTNVVLSPSGASLVPFASASNWFAVVMPSTTNAGAVDVTIQTESYGEIMLSDAYTYNPAGSILDLSLASGLCGGGYNVVIGGVNLGNGSDITNVTLCGIEAAIQPGQSATQLVVVAGLSNVGVCTGDVQLASTGYGITKKVAAFEYFKEQQTIDFPEIGTQRMTNGVTLSATASSGLPVTYSIVSGPGMITGGTNLTFSGAGEVLVRAVQAGDVNWDEVCTTQSVTVVKNAVFLDFDGDGRADVAVYWPEYGDWYILQSGTMTGRVQPWGWSESQPVPGDYDGDGKYDMAVYNDVYGMWYILQSETGTGRFQAWGAEGYEPVQADYDGDGKTDVAVFDAAHGVWHILQSSDGQNHTQAWGWSETVPVPGDYDGDGKADCAVYWADGGQWYILQSSTGTGYTQPWGWSDAEAVPGDFDGDGKADMAAYWPEQGVWLIWQSALQTMRSQKWGWEQARPVPADYDGDGKYEITVYAPTEGMWYIWQSRSQTQLLQRWGWSDALPVYQ